VPSNCLAELPCFGGPAKADPDFAAPPYLPGSSRTNPGCWDTAVAVLHAPSHPRPPNFAIAAFWMAPMGLSLTEPQHARLRGPSDPRVATAGASQGSALPTPDVASWLNFPATSPNLPSSPPAQVQVHRTVGRYPINKQTLLQDLAYDGAAKSGGEVGSWTSTATGELPCATWT
jgi:hypothetical protein